MKKIIEIKEEVKIGNVILEVGDKIQKIEEQESLSREFKEAWIEFNEALTTMEDELFTDREFRSFIKQIDSINKKMEKYLDISYPNEIV